MRSFGSDNNSGVHPIIMQALIDANSNHTIAYGDDKWTYKAVDIIRDKINSSDINPLFVFNGTGANVIALQACTNTFNSIL